MLTEHGSEADSVASGVISIENGLDFATLQDEHGEMKGTLILAGEEEEDDDEERSQLSLPESVLLPSEMTVLENKIPVAVEQKGDKGNDQQPRCRSDSSNSQMHQCVILFLAAFLLAITSFALWGYINARNEVHRLENLVVELEARLHSKSSTDNIFTTHRDDDAYEFENCYFKVGLTAGECSKDWMAWFNEYMFDHTANRDEDHEEKFMHQLLDSMKASTSHMTFERLNFAYLLSSSINAMNGIHKHYDDEGYQSSFANMTESLVDKGLDSVSRILNVSSSWLRTVYELVSEEDLVAWN
jgi:hypothetical protein